MSGSFPREDIRHFFVAEFSKGKHSSMLWFSVAIFHGFCPMDPMGRTCFPQLVLHRAASRSPRCAPSISWSLGDVLRDCVHYWRQPSVTKCWRICSDSSTGKNNVTELQWGGGDREQLTAPETHKAQWKSLWAPRKTKSTQAVQPWSPRHQPKHKV